MLSARATWLRAECAFFALGLNDRFLLRAEPAFTLSCIFPNVILSINIPLTQYLSIPLIWRCRIVLRMYAQSRQTLRLESALPKALDLEKVGDSMNALQTLGQALSKGSADYKVFSPTLEEGVMLFMQMSVRSFVIDARQVLQDFRTTCGAEHAASFEKVARRYVELAEKAAMPVLNASLDAAADDELFSPEALTLFAQGGPEAEGLLRDRKDRKSVV